MTSSRGSLVSELLTTNEVIKAKLGNRYTNKGSLMVYCLKDLEHLTRDWRVYVFEN